MARVNINVYLKDNSKLYYECVDVNKLEKFQHVFRDSFLSWQIFEMQCKHCYHFSFHERNYLNFFKDFLMSEFEFDKQLSDIDMLYIYGEHVNEGDYWITVGGDEKWL